MVALWGSLVAPGGLVANDDTRRTRGLQGARMGDRLVQPLRLGIHLHGLPRLALEDHGKTDRRCAGIFPITGHQAPFLRPSSFSSVIPIPPWPAMAPREADPSFKRTI